MSSIHIHNDLVLLGSNRTFRVSVLYGWDTGSCSDICRIWILFCPRFDLYFIFDWSFILPLLFVFGLANSDLISTNWLMLSPAGEGAPAIAGEGAPATADEDELSAERSGIQPETEFALLNIAWRVWKIVDLRRPPFLAEPTTAFNNHLAFLSTLTKDTVPRGVSISFVSRPWGLLRRPPATDQFHANLIGANVMVCKAANCNRHCGANRPLLR